MHRGVCSREACQPFPEGRSVSDSLGLPAGWWGHGQAGPSILHCGSATLWAVEVGSPPRPPNLRVHETGKLPQPPPHPQEFTDGKHLLFGGQERLRVKGCWLRQMNSVCSRDCLTLRYASASGLICQTLSKPPCCLSCRPGFFTDEVLLQGPHPKQKRN